MQKKDTLTYPQLTAFQHHQVEGLSIPATAKIVGVDESTIDRWKARPAWNELAVVAIEKKGHTLEHYAEKLIQMKDKEKEINVGGKLETVDDNQAQIAYLKEIAQIYGLYAPKDINLKHTLAEASDAGLASSIESAEREYGLAGEGREPAQVSGSTPEK